MHDCMNERKREGGGRGWERIRAETDIEEVEVIYNILHIFLQIHLQSYIYMLCIKHTG